MVGAVGPLIRPPLQQFALGVPPFIIPGKLTAAGQRGVKLALQCQSGHRVDRLIRPRHALGSLPLSRFMSRRVAGSQREPLKINENCRNKTRHEKGASRRGAAPRMYKYFSMLSW